MEIQELPIVSVVIPTYNRASLVKEAIKSVLAQTFSQFEIIIIDDGSTDSTERELFSFIRKGVVRYHFQQNAGGAEARNAGMRLAAGKYIAFLDSDDLFHPQKLEKQISYLERNQEVGMIHSGFSKIDGMGRDLGYRDNARLTGWVYPAILHEWTHLIGASTVIVTKEVLDRVGEFDSAIWPADLDMWARIARLYPIAVIPEDLAKIRVHPGNMSGQRAEIPQRFLKYLQKSFNNDHDLSLIFKRRGLARMYAQTGLNILGEGSNEDMITVRDNSVRAIKFWPPEWRAYLAYGGSFLGDAFRAKLVNYWRDYKFKPYRRF